MHITQAALQTLGSNEAAIAFLIIRTEILGCYAITNDYVDFGTQDNGADLVALLATMKAGYDPGAAADALARLAAANYAGVPVDGTLLGSLGIPTGWVTRLQNLYSSLNGMCSSTAAVRQECTAAHNLWHPLFPSQVP